MVEKEIIIKSINDALNKCNDYPKAIALTNYNSSEYLNDD